MPRRPREEEAGAVHHVFARGNRKQAIYVDDRDREVYLAWLGRSVERCGWRCLAYCLMHNHMHLLLETPRPNLGVGMQWCHGHYARDFNDRYGLSGHLFQDRYGSKRIRDDVQLFTVARYIARNPVLAGLCEQPHEWPWSSDGAIAAQRAPSWLDRGRMNAYLSADGGEARWRYAALVGDLIVESDVQRALLTALLGGPGPASSAELARRVGVTKQNALYHLVELRRRGLVTMIERTRCWVALGRAAGLAVAA